MFENLYKNIGEKIKGLAVWVFIVETIGSIILGLILAFEEDILYIFITLCGPIIAFVSSWVLYAFGELVEKTSNNGNNTRLIYGLLKNNFSTKAVHTTNENSIPSKPKITTENKVIDKPVTATASNIIWDGDNVLIVKEGAKSIDDSAFSRNTRLETVVLPEGLVKIGEGAFYRCKNLKRIQIPNSVKEIGNSSFFGCDNLTIHASLNSYAHTYASIHMINFDSSPFEI